jgi:hypothetical protein
VAREKFLASFSVGLTIGAISYLHLRPRPQEVSEPKPPEVTGGLTDSQALERFEQFKQSKQPVWRTLYQAPAKAR